MSFSSQVTLWETVETIQSFLRPRHLNTIRQSCESSGILSFCICCLKLFFVNRKQAFRPCITNSTFNNITFIKSITTSTLQSNLFRRLTRMSFSHFFFQHTQTFWIVGVHTFVLHSFTDRRHCLHRACRKNFLNGLSDNTRSNHAVPAL